MKNYNKLEGGKGIILVMVLWVLFFLSIVVLTLGFKNRMNIRLRSLDNEQMRAFYLAKEGVNRMIVKLAADHTGFDSLDEDWNKQLVLEEDNGTLSVEVTDEDRYLNINLIAKDILFNAAELFDGLQKEDMEVIEKKRPFNIARELKDITMIDEDKFDIITSEGKVKFFELFTTFSDGKLNINTAPREVLLMVPGLTMSAVEAIIDRRENSPFENRDTLSEEISLLGLTPEQVVSLVKAVKVDSSVFRIRSKAVSAGKSIEKSIEVVIKRENDGFKMLYVREN